jgi:hypothetical protein
VLRVQLEQQVHNESHEKPDQQELLVLPEQPEKLELNDLRVLLVLRVQLEQRVDWPVMR